MCAFVCACLCVCNSPPAALLHTGSEALMTRTWCSLHAQLCRSLCWERCPDCSLRPPPPSMRCTRARACFANSLSNVPCTPAGRAGWPSQRRRRRCRTAGRGRGRGHACGQPAAPAQRPAHVHAQVLREAPQPGDCLQAKRGRLRRPPVAVGRPVRVAGQAHCRWCLAGPPLALSEGTSQRQHIVSFDANGVYHCIQMHATLKPAWPCGHTSRT